MGLRLSRHGAMVRFIWRTLDGSARLTRCVGGRRFEGMGFGNCARARSMRQSRWRAGAGLRGDTELFLRFGQDGFYAEMGVVRLEEVGLRRVSFAPSGPRTMKQLASSRVALAKAVRRVPCGGGSRLVPAALTRSLPAFQG